MAPPSRPAPRRRRGVVGALLALLVVIGLGAPAQAGSTAPPDPATLDRIDAFVEEQRDARRVPGVAFAIVADGRVVRARGLGSADGSGRAVTPRTPFVLGSVSKSITALAVMQLVDAGRVTLDEPVARLVPELRLADGAERRITIRHLLTQTSGIPATAGGRLLKSVGDGTMEEAVAELDGAAPAARPGARFEYANANYVLLGLVVERVSGEPYGAYVERHVFAPLGMRDSFASPDAARRAGLAEGHRYWFGVPVGHGPTSPDGLRPAGYLMSSAADMARYLAMVLGDGAHDGRRIVSREGMAILLRPAAAATMGAWSGHHESRYAMGWYAGGPWSERVLLHPGGSPDSSAMIAIVPGRDVAVVTLANANTEMPLPGADGSLDRIPRGVVSLLVGEEPQTGISLTRFYLVFDAVVLAVLGAIGWAVVRLARRRDAAPATRRRAIARAARGTAEVAVGALLLGAPALLGMGVAGAMLWIPDLALAVLVTGGLLALLGAARLALLVRYGAGEGMGALRRAPSPAGSVMPRASSSARKPTA